MTDTSTLLPCPHLESCPWCGCALYAVWRRANPRASCKTEGCFGRKMAVVNLDDPSDVAAWNRRALAPASQPVATPAGMEPYQRSADGTDVPPELASTARPASIAAVEVAAPSAPVRVPLADEQIEKLCAEIGFTSWPEWDGGTFQEMWMQLARAIETAHGITAAQNGGKHGTD